jgi:hypothetical protein
MTPPPSEDVRDIVEYDKQTGELRWKVDMRTGSVRQVVLGKAGEVAGTKNKHHGYVTIRINGRQYIAHRVAWWLATGEWPIAIDHKDGDRANNKFENLRAADYKINNQNRRRAIPNSTTGFLGVTRTPEGRFVARIGVNGKNLYFGTHETPEQAHEAYLAAKREFHEGCTI